MRGVTARLGGSIALFFVLLAASSALTLRQNDLTPVSLPTPLTLAGWGIALVILLVGIWRRTPRLLAVAAVLELALASLIMPYNQLVPPDSYTGQRFTTSQLLALTQDQVPPPRTLSISQLLFDPGDRASLQAQHDALGMSPEAVALAFDTVKMRETLAANQPLVWGIPSIDGFDGGLLPTTYYSAFTSLFLPNNEPTPDGRLRELLARPECGGACIPAQRWLDLMGVRYLITDKNYDLVHDGIFYDTQLPARSNTYYENPQNFIATAIDILCAPCDGVRVEYGETFTQSDSTPLNNYARLRFTLNEPTAAPNVVIRADESAIIHAVTLVDTRTDAFQQLAPFPWTRVLSSDIKLYQHNNLLTRTGFTNKVTFVTDDDTGTQATLNLMRDPGFPIGTGIAISGIVPDDTTASTGGFFGSAPITAYTDLRVTLNVITPYPGYVVLYDAYYPGWVATVNGEPTPVERANIMFRAVRVPAGQSEVVFEYRPAWLPAILIIGAAAWLVVLIAALALRKSKRGELHQPTASIDQPASV